MYNFCTLFDSHYFSKGLALYYSLEKNCPDFHLYIFAFNDKAYIVLKKMNLSKATIISLAEFEDEELLRVKNTRSIAEYCWTCTSSTILYALNKYNLESCTYIDSDIFFYSNPEPIFNEMGDDSILITEHRYSPQYNKMIKAGKYCVQFVTFKNNQEGLTALQWWRDRCIEWCYARYEEGKFGDQLYLDDWTERFKGVHVLKHLGGGLAAWNIQQYNFEENNGKLEGTEISSNTKFDVIFYHYHYLNFYTNGYIELGRRILTRNVLNSFYKPYIRFINEINKKILLIDDTFDPRGATTKPIDWKTPILYLYRKLNGIYNIFSESELLGK